MKNRILIKIVLFLIVCPSCWFILFSWVPSVVTFLKVLKLWVPLTFSWHDKAGHIDGFIFYVGMWCCPWSWWNLLWVVSRGRTQESLWSQNSVLDWVPFKVLLRTWINSVGVYFLNLQLTKMRGLENRFRWWNVNFKMCLDFNSVQTLKLLIGENINSY